MWLCENLWDIQVSSFLDKHVYEGCVGHSVLTCLSAHTRHTSAPNSTLLASLQIKLSLSYHSNWHLHRKRFNIRVSNLSPQLKGYCLFVSPCYEVAAMTSKPKCMPNSCQQYVILVFLQHIIMNHMHNEDEWHWPTFMVTGSNQYVKLTWTK